MNEWRRLALAVAFSLSCSTFSFFGQAAVTNGEHRPGETKVNPKDGLTYVWMPPGTFTMGCSPGDSDCDDEEKPAHQVTLTKGFWIGQTEVTEEAFQRVTGHNPSHFKGPKLPVETLKWDAAR